MVARHFNGRVRAVSIWNEPNWHGLLKPERICGKVTKVKKIKVKGKKKAKRKKVTKRVCVKTSARRYRAHVPRRLQRHQARGAHDAGVDR